MNRLLLPIFLLLATSAVATERNSIPFFLHADESNGVLKGKVFDDLTKQPLAGATIYIHDIKVGAISKADGSYITSDITEGKYLVEVSYQGYSSVIENITVNGNTERNFFLKTAVREQEAVTVTGVASAVRTKTSSQPVSIVRRNDLLQTSSTNAIEALTKIVPGVSAVSTGPAIAKPQIRGLGYNRVVVINDGIRQEGQQWGDEHGIEIDEYSIQRIEVLKGPASLMYGSDAMAGVINMISNVPVNQGTMKGNVFANYNTNCRLYGLNGNLAGHLDNGFNWNFYSTYKSSGDYQNKYDGYVLNSRFKEANIGGYAGVNKQWGYAHVLVSNVHQRLGIIEGERDPVSGVFLIYPESVLEREATSAEMKGRDLLTPYQTIDHFKITSDNNFSLGKDRLSVVAGYQRNQRREFGDPENMRTPDLYFDLNSINYNLQYHLADRNGWKNSFGVSGLNQTNKNKAEEVLIPEYSLNDIGAFFYTRKQVNSVTISGGLRADHRTLDSKFFQDAVTTKFNAFKKNYTNISGSAGVSIEASHEVNIKLNIARGFRAPNIAELASNGVHEGTNRYEYGDPNLKSEVSLQADAGFEMNTEHFSFGLNAYYNNLDNFIYYGKLESTAGGDSILNINGDVVTAFKFRQQQASLKGFEFNLDIHPHPFDWLHFENAISYVRGTFNTAIDGSKNLPFIPAMKWRSELRFDIKKLTSSFKDSYLSLEMDKTFNQDNAFTGYNTETITPGYTLLNLNFGTIISSKEKALFSLNFAWNNITDVAYQSHLSRLKYTADNNATGRSGVFNMGSSFNIKLNVPLEFKL